MNAAFGNSCSQTGPEGFMVFLLQAKVSIRRAFLLPVPSVIWCTLAILGRDFVSGTNTSFGGCFWRSIRARGLTPASLLETALLLDISIALLGAAILILAVYVSGSLCLDAIVFCGKVLLLMAMADVGSFKGLGLNLAGFWLRYGFAGSLFNPVSSWFAFIHGWPQPCLVPIEGELAPVEVGILGFPTHRVWLTGLLLLFPLTPIEVDVNSWVVDVNSWVVVIEVLLWETLCCLDNSVINTQFVLESFSFSFCRLIDGHFMKAVQDDGFGVHGKTKSVVWGSIKSPLSSLFWRLLLIQCINLLYALFLLAVDFAAGSGLLALV